MKLTTPIFTQEFIYQNQIEQEFLDSRIKVVRQQLQGFQDEIIKARKRADSVPDSGDNLQYDDTGEIKAATKERLIEAIYLTEASKDSKDFPSTFLLTYRYFATPREVISLFADGYNRESPSVTATHLLAIHIKAVGFLKKWVESFFDDFEEDAEAMQQCAQLIESMTRTDARLGPKFQISQSLDASYNRRKQQKTDQDKKESIGNSFSEKPPQTFPCKINPPQHILDLHPQEVARQLTLIDYELCKAIRPKECLLLAWTKKDKAKRSPNLLAMIERFNHVSRWVTYTLVTEQNLKKRTKILAFFLQLLQHLYELNNFNAIFQIVGGFGNSSVHRLKKTFAGLKPPKDKILKDMTFFCDPAKSWSNYRKTITEVNPPCVPFVGVYQTDLTFIEEGNPDKFSTTGLINFKKCRMIAEVIVLIQQYQQKPYNLVKCEKVTKLLNQEFARALAMDERELYEQSLKAEPRAQ